MQTISLGSNHGTLKNDTTFAAGMVGQAFSFDGANDYIEVPDPPGNTSFDLDYVTLEMWIKPAMAVGSSTGVFPVDKRAPGTWTGEYATVVRGNGNHQVGIDAGLPSYLGSDDAGISSFPSSGLIPMNAWTHMAYTWDGNTLVVYRNGQVIGTDSGSGPMVKNSLSLKIGIRADLLTSSSYKGLIDELSIYNRALAAAEIQAIFNASSAGKCKAVDADGDGFSADVDCNDTNLNIHPGATETCNNVDDNCNVTVDEGFDAGDSCTVGTGACQKTGTKVCKADGSATECNATPGTPGTETCNGIDDDCDGAVDESPTSLIQPLTQPCYSGPNGTAGVGVCQVGTQTCSDGTFGLTCPGEVTPSAEVCDGQDNDCDGASDEEFPTKGQVCDGADTDLCTNGTFTCKADGSGVECVNETVTNIAEVCDGQDNDCDEQTDEGVTSTFYQDGDNDGFGNSASSTQACSAPVGYVTNSTDCNDGSAAVHPGAAEICGDGIDQDCDGVDDNAITQIDDLIADVKSLGLDKGTEKSLLAKLDAAKSSLEKGNTKAAEGQLNAFINEVNAQRGKKIPTAAADDLIDQAQAIIVCIP